MMNAAKVTIKERKYVSDKKDNLILLADDGKLQEVSHVVNLLYITTRRCPNWFWFWFSLSPKVLIILTNPKYYFKIMNAYSCADLYQAIGQDFWLSTWCNNTAVEGYFSLFYILEFQCVNYFFSRLYYFEKCFFNFGIFLLFPHFRKSLEGTRITLMKKYSFYCINWFQVFFRCSLFVHSYVIVAFRGESGFDFAIRTPCTPARWEDYDLEMTAAWEVYLL